MIHQTFYIDIDEEITSIVDKIRKSKSREIVMVVPKRALLIQSIVNLKLLKKEADSLRKVIIVVTQDDVGKMLVEKAGITVEEKIDDFESEEMSPLETDQRRQAVYAGGVFLDDKKYEVKAENRVNSMGSAEYFEDSAEASSSKITVRNEEIRRSGAVASPVPSNMPSGSDRFFQAEPEDREITASKDLAVNISADMKKIAESNRAATFDMVKNVNLRQSGASEFFENFRERNIGKTKKNGKEALEKMREKTYSYYGKVHLSGKFWKYFTVIGAIAILVVAAAAAYLFLPRAEIKIYAKTKSQSIDAQVKGDTKQSSVDLDREVIPARLISADDQLKKSFTVTGSTASGGQKARGTITIYNEYSNSSQTLVATTRFESPDGKIFRLTKTTVVPGMTSVEGKLAPGAIEADVVADASGEVYNIEPASFTIPGFKDSGNEKYTKFYAKSFKSMSGGAGGSKTAKAISAGDISDAKNKTLAELSKVLKKKLKESAGGQIVLDDAVSISDATYSVSNSEGEITDNFSVTVKAKANAIIFSEQDLKEVLKKDLAKTGSSENQLNEKSLSLQYGKADADFPANAITIRVNASGKIGPEIDVENLKKGILGKTEEEFREYLKAYPSIERAEINYWPAFISGKIPDYEKRVTLELDND